MDAQYYKVRLLRKGGLGSVIAATLLLILILLALVTVLKVINRFEEVNMEKAGGSEAVKAYAASLLSVGLCACTSHNMNLTNATSPYVSIIYKGNVKLPLSPC